MDGVLDILPTDAGTFLSEHGIRGAPVVLQELDLVIGIIAATERQKEGTTVYAISASVLRSAFPDRADLYFDLSPALPGSCLK